MREISYEEGKKFILEGKHIICKIADKEEKYIKDITELDAEKRLKDQGVQDKFVLYLDDEVKLPENSYPINLDGALILMKKGDKIYTLDEKNEKEFHTQNELLTFYRMSIVQNKDIILYHYA